MAAKPTSRSGQSRTKSSSKAKSSNSSGSKARAGGGANTGARTARAGSGSTRSKAAAAKRQAEAQAPASRDSNGFIGTIKQTASKAKGPAIAVSAAAVGAAGGALLRDRTRKTTVLGVPVPRRGKSKGPDFDLPEMAKSVGRATVQFGQKTKSVSRDMERVGDRAERIGKMLS